MASTEAPRDFIETRPRWRCVCCGAGMSGYRCKRDGSQAIFLCAGCERKSRQLLEMGIKPTAIAQGDTEIERSVRHLAELMQEQTKNKVSGQASS